MNEDVTTGPSDLVFQGMESQPLAAPSPDLDPAKYLPEMAEFEITEAQKVELLQTLWSIMRSFVELGFDVKICEQLLLEPLADARNPPLTVEWPPSTTTGASSDTNGRGDQA